ncbi:hypothetical protein Palpr_0928 [Paludibacter propionicigenes WB4]|uniref:DUF4835 domain-containing protein n=1 Tax=Paludibacter propionicigenes (strain DSM 17365 / JCM 13257 / WB4) TaxID=694427 RepID=E4T2Y4_PALPW|nr:DUF4835 family protein [Paludibacter propionicigenes]ADQ79078.1 hypothetical protein Palpr_0928 [Paludibacter propionicigenes WB4]
MKYYLLLFSIFLTIGSISAQELNCTVQINSDQIQGTNKSVFNTLQKSISDFMNNRKWTELSFGNTERIECTLNIIIKKVDSDVFTSEIQVQSRRPIFNSAYNSTLFNFRDQQFTFNYKEFDQLEINQNAITSNLTAVLAYYAYIIIGYDMDSYSRLGGTAYFQSAESIVNSAQGADMTGWKAFESTRNRYALVNNLLDEAFKRYRNYFYEYHRLGLDEMSNNATNARARIAEGLPFLREANRSRPSAVVISSFLEAKNDELVNVFSKGSTQEKSEAIEILTDINPTQSDRYSQILKTY